MEIGVHSKMLVASYVHHLKISGDFESAEIRLGDLSSLVHVDHTFYCDEDDIIDETIVKDLLVSVRCANELVVTSWFIKNGVMINNLLAFPGVSNNAVVSLGSVSGVGFPEE
ncbi:hypothetical protein RND71_011636 [Anisodus tanguticus]|uniref:Uncharacterized protein n=1 Tax=Anisodus tanguticus TaxID=243964 RepID=A0AAE1SBP5_9SOLA|nr:hypothetical protein RND71_011636 [Anisodus tanguticus]